MAELHASALAASEGCLHLETANRTGAASPSPAPRAGKAHAGSEDRLQSLYESFFLQCYHNLHDHRGHGPAGKNAWAWLRRRGFDAAAVDSLPLGLMTECAAMRQQLRALGYSRDEIRASELAADPRLPGRLTGAIRTAHGRIVGFWARSVREGDVNCLYRGNWRSHTPLIGLDRVLRDADASAAPVLLVEDWLDALLLQSHGVEQVAAIGGPAEDLAVPRWQRLADLRVGAALVPPCGTLADPRRIEATIERACLAEPAVSVVVLGAASPGDLLAEAEASSDDRLTALGRDGLHGLTFKALAILGRHRPETAWTDAARRTAWKEAAEFYLAFRDRLRGPLEEHFIPPLAAELDIDWDPWAFRPHPHPKPVPPPAPPAPPVAAPLPSPPPRPSRARERRNHRPSSDFCRLHRCATTVCFCFD